MGIFDFFSKPKKENLDKGLEKTKDSFLSKIARAVVDDDEKLNEIFEEIDQKTEVGEFTQDETRQPDNEVEQEEI